jgi:tRNA nucleotidyltransferase (CCA-adding enzyme)
MPAGSGRTTLERDAGATVLKRLLEQPGGSVLLELTDGREDVELVGGAVRDLLLGLEPREWDVAVDGDAPLVARALAEQLGVEAIVHERFGTASVQCGEVRFDFATRRAEHYHAPGALPEVRAGTALEDLLRRDFTVNAIAVTLNGSTRGQLRAAPQALDDLRERRLRVLHEQSFRDDPTRLLRLARYSARLDFAVQEHTAEMARAAVSDGALSTVSGARVGAELRLALAEACAPQVLLAMQEYGILAAVHPRLRHDAALVARALELLPADGSRELLLLAALVLPLTVRADGHPEAEARALLNRLEFPAPERDHVVRSALDTLRLFDELPARARPGELYRMLAESPIEAVALAAACERADGRADDAVRAAHRWLGELRHVRLHINGEDLLAAGVPEGPEVGRRLHETLLLRLEGELAEGSEAELRAALGSAGKPTG